MTEETFLNDVWSVYFHDPDDSDWSIQSYKLIGTVSSVEDFVAMHQGLQELWGLGMFFLMREHIQPLWEDEKNEHGGCLSFKVYPNDVARVWMECCAAVLGERIGKDTSAWDRICGISIAPKRGYSLIRFWTSDTTSFIGNDALAVRLPSYAKTIFKAHQSA